MALKIEGYRLTFIWDDETEDDIDPSDISELHTEIVKIMKYWEENFNDKEIKDD
jgi:hypothetical protein